MVFPLNLKKLSDFCSKKATEAILFSLIYGTLWISTDQVAKPPNGRVFVLCALFATSYIGGEICSLLNLPPLLGMLIGGLALRNSSNITIHAPTSAVIRNFALATILLRAGLGLNPTVLKKLSTVCLRLAFAPCIAETLTTAVTGRIIYGLPLQWGVLLGFALSAVSPAIVVKLMLSLKERHLGTDKGIPTLVIAAASIDDVLAITGFGIALGIVYADDEHSSLMWEIFKGPLEAFFGIIFGVVIGALLSILPMVHGDDEESVATVHTQRLIVTLLFGIFLLLTTREADFSGVGALAALTSTFVAAMKWRLKKEDLEVDKGLKMIWNLLEPFLFGLIGAEVQLNILRLATVFLSLVSLTIGLIIRCSTVILVSWGANFNLKEKCFVSLAWMPKATVQAALGPISLDVARERGDYSAINFGALVLQLAVISIFVTAPLGALAISITAPYLLSKEVESTKSDDKSSKSSAKVVTNF